MTSRTLGSIFVAHEECEGDSVQNLAAKEIERETRQQRGASGQMCSNEG
jgi:hypothetical protein